MALLATDNLFSQRSPYSPTDYVRIDGDTLFQISNSLMSGVKMVFLQAAAPAGWVRSNLNSDSMVRLVSTAGGGSSGSINASTFMVASYPYSLNLVGPLNFSLAPTTLTTAQLPSHSHSGGGTSATPGPGKNPGGNSIAGLGGGQYTTDSAGGGAAHAHNFSGSSFSIGATSPGNFDIRYVDSIECVKV